MAFQTNLGGRPMKKRYGSVAFLSNFTKDQTIEDPINYYDRLSDRYYGATKLMYMQIESDLREMELHMLINEYTYVVSADYLNM